MAKSPRTLARAIRATKDRTKIIPLARAAIRESKASDAPELFAHILARLDRIERELGIGVDRG